MSEGRLRRSSELPVFYLGSAQPRYPWNFSPSQIDIWQQCQAKWGYKYIDHAPGSNKYADRGKDLHRVLEAWLAHAQEPPDDRIGRLARAGLKLLPVPGTAQVEGDFILVSANGIKHRGAIDLFYWDGDTPVITDHKSTTDFKWALTEETLKVNGQAITYAAKTMVAHQRDVVRLDWIYYKDHKTKPRVKKVSACVDLEHVLCELDKADRLAIEIGEVGLKAKRALDLPRNAASCEAKGGCPYRDICPVTDAERLGAIMEQQSIRDRLMRQTQQTPTTAQATGASAGASILAQMRARTGAAPATAPAQVTPAARPSLTPAANAAVTAAMPGFQQRMAAHEPQQQPQQPQQPQQQQGPRIVVRPADSTGPQTPQTSAQTATQTTPQARAPQAVGVGLSALERMRARTSTVPSQENNFKSHVPAVYPPRTVEQYAANMDAAAARHAPVETAHDSVPAETEAPQPSQPAFHAYDINPPEQPEQPIDDPAALQAAVEQAKEEQGEKKKRGRPPGAVTSAKAVRGVVGGGVDPEAFIFGLVFADVCRDTHGDIKVAGDFAAHAVREFRKLSTSET